MGGGTGRLPGRDVCRISPCMYTRGVHTRPEPDPNPTPTRKSGSFGLACDYVGLGRDRVPTLIFGLRSGLKS